MGAPRRRPDATISRAALVAQGRQEPNEWQQKQCIELIVRQASADQISYYILRMQYPAGSGWLPPALAGPTWRARALISLIHSSEQQLYWLKTGGAKYQIYTRAQNLARLSRDTICLACMQIYRLEAATGRRLRFELANSLTRESRREARGKRRHRDTYTSLE